VDLAALVVSVVAATIAVLAFGWSIGWSVWQHRRMTAPQALVEGRFAVLATEPIQTVFGITVVNEGLVPFSVTGVFAELEGASQFLGLVRFVMQSPRDLPTVLTPGESWSGFVEAEDFRSGMAELGERVRPPWRIRVGVHGPGRRNYVSDWFELSPE
jgi:hypothetical protein